MIYHNRCVGKNAKLIVRTLKYTQKPLSTEKLPRAECNSAPGHDTLDFCDDPMFPDDKYCQTNQQGKCYDILCVQGLD